MLRVFKVLAIFALIAMVGCCNSKGESEEEFKEANTVNSSFTGTIKEVKSNTAIVSAKLGGAEGDVFVDLSVNRDEIFQIGDRVMVEYDGTIMESNPAQINTISVKLIEY